MYTDDAFIINIGTNPEKLKAAISPTKGKTTQYSEANTFK
jgi:hypothetical protein